MELKKLNRVRNERINIPMEIRNKEVEIKIKMKFIIDFLSIKYSQTYIFIAKIIIL
ncbi:MAG: hypothetical protein QXT38_01450 [Candidatus Aenigmatarchaeota archaeon]